MQIKTTNVYEKTIEAYMTPGIRRVLEEGGTSSSKTWSILELLIFIARGAKKKLLISVVSESLPHLKHGAIRDFFNILGETQKNNPNWNATDHIYRFKNAQIEFFGADDSAKVRGPRRDILFINEANNIPWDTAHGLDIRTNQFTFTDWNPVSEFWVHTNWVGQKENAYIHSTYKDALDVLPESVIRNIESNRDKDPNWWNVYGLGRLGKIEGLVYPHFKIVKELPDGDYFYGLDFGYTHDPSALVKNVIIDDSIYSKELFYETGLTNQQIGKKFEEFGVRKNYDEIFADSAEPKSIDEISLMGFNIKGVSKGPGSINFRHQKMRQYKQYWTEDSLHCIKEQRNFRYIEDKNGKLTDKTTHNWSHGMDARDYGLMGRLGFVVNSEEQEEVIVYDAMSQVDIDY